MKDITKALGLDTSNSRRYALNKGFKFMKTRTVESRNQPTLCLSKDDFDKLVAMRKDEAYINNVNTNNNSLKKINLNASGIGVFYIIQLMPDELPNRVKLGYATSLDRRAQAHKTTCPNLKILFQYKIKEVWEKAIIDMMSCASIKRKSQEVFDVKNVKVFIEYAKKILSKFPEI